MFEHEADSNSIHRQMSMHEKTIVDLSSLLNGVISLPDATSCDKKIYCIL